MSNKSIIILSVTLIIIAAILGGSYYLVQQHQLKYEQSQADLKTQTATDTKKELDNCT